MKENKSPFHEYVWLVPAGDHACLEQAAKVMALLKGGQSKLTVLILNRQRFMERAYWRKLMPPSEQANLDAVTVLDQFTGEIKQALSTSGRNILVQSFNNPTRKDIDEYVKGKHSVIWLMSDSASMRKEPLFQRLGNFSQPVLLLSKHAWSDSRTVLAAIDPLHEKARAANMDERIVAYSSQLAKDLNAKHEFVHCCFVSPVSMKYKDRIVEFHKEGVEEFLDEHKIDWKYARVLMGNPENALPQYVRKSKASLMIMGLTARGWVEEMIIGSTTGPLLDEPPCDLFLIPEAS